MTHINGRGLARASGVAVLAIVTAIGWGCSKDTPGPSMGAMDAAGDGPVVDQIRSGSDARLDSPVEIPPDAQPTPPANVSFPEPPLLTCSVASDCDFPPSACADPSCNNASSCPGIRWVVYYDNPQCTAWRCVF